MLTPHLINLLIHIGAGTIAIVLGFVVIARAKGTAAHIRLGRVFGAFTLVVCLSAALGLALFRFMPLFAVLTILISYQLGSGWRCARTKESGPGMVDALWTLAAVAASVIVVPIVLREVSPTDAVVKPTLGALGTMLLYDTVRWFFPRRWHRTAWRYEHSYKLLASLFGMISALVGNVVRVGQPWSQLAPSAVGIVVAVYYFVKIYREDRRAAR